MRTKALLCAAGIIAAGVATSMAQGVTSLNVVGYQTVVPSANKFILVENPVTNTSVANTLLNLIGTNAPNASQVYKWNYAQSKFDIFTRTPFAPFWSAPGGSGINITNVTLNVGEGFFIKSPSQWTNIWVGEVFQAFSPNSPGPITNSLPVGLQLTGNKVPDTGYVTNMNFNIPVGSPANQLLKWNFAGQKYDIYSRTPFAPGWSLAGVVGGTVPQLDVGDGFFTKLSASYDWIRNFTVQ